MCLQVEVALRKVSGDPELEKGVIMGCDVYVFARWVKSELAALRMRYCEEPSVMMN